MTVPERELADFLVALAVVLGAFGLMFAVDSLVRWLKNRKKPHKGD